MKRLHIQLQPARSPELDVAEAVVRLRLLADGVRISEGEDDGRYLNLDFKVMDLPGLWRKIQDVLRSVPALAGAAIIVCEGELGWDDYLLLHHFNPQEPVDQLG